MSLKTDINKIMSSRIRLDKCGLRLKSRQGFTFAEVLAALLLMAIVLPVAMQGLTVANRAGVVAERKRTAAQLADLKINEIIVTQAWKDAAQSGNFGTTWKDYRWEMTKESWETDAMQLITVTVYFTAQDQEYSVRMSTLVDESEE